MNLYRCVSQPEAIVAIHSVLDESCMALAAIAAIPGAAKLPERNFCSRIALSIPLVNDTFHGLIYWFLYPYRLVSMSNRFLIIIPLLNAINSAPFV